MYHDQVYELDENGIIISPGKFEGEMYYVPYFWDAVLNGDGEDIYDEDTLIGCKIVISPQERYLFPDIEEHYNTVTLWEDNSGFVYCTLEA